MTANHTQPLVLIVGTRPEGIKMMPVYFALKNAGHHVLLCSTMQHDQLLSEVFDLFGVKPDIDLSVMRLGQDLFYLTQSILQKTKEVFTRVNPAMVVVQGDTTSTMAAALAAFYLKIPVAHIEAGLRTDDIYSPFPEEINRRFVSTIAQYHFAPTAQAAAQLMAEGVAKESIFCVGNTVVDALTMIKTKIANKQISPTPRLVGLIDQIKTAGKQLVLLTTHRRESFDGGIDRILRSLHVFLTTRDDISVIYPFHPNPQVVKAISAAGLSRLENIHLTEPLSYTDLVYTLDQADWVMTDSGGIQEEAISLAKPVLVLREKTERIEGVWAGLARLVGTDEQQLLVGMHDCASGCIDGADQAYAVYGTGQAASAIVSLLEKHVTKVKTMKQKEQSIQTHEVKKKEASMQNVSVLGLGYIGLPTAIVLAESGWQVHGIDINAERVDAINAGDPVIQEPEVFEKLQLVLTAGNFKVSTVCEPADYFIIAVPTPFKEEKKADLSYVYAAADAIAAVIKAGDVVILESTVPVGATEKLAAHLAAKTGLVVGTDIFVAHCPERVLPGKIFYELIQNSRIIGGVDKPSVQKAKELYSSFVQGKLYLTNAKEAEMVKLIENSSRDTQIAFAHQVASMAYSVGLNPYEVIELANKHPRVNILQPSCGVGGHCIAVDPWFLIESFPDNTQLIAATRAVNDAKPHEVFSMIESAVAQFKHEQAQDPVVGLFGLTYKPDVDDLRESPALQIAQMCTARYSDHVLVTEPHLNNNQLESQVGTCARSVTDALDEADIIVFLVAHTRFKAIDRKKLHGKIVMDMCGVLHEQTVQSDDPEQSFWPASNMDFFIVNQARRTTQQGTS